MNAITLNAITEALKKTETQIIDLKIKLIKYLEDIQSFTNLLHTRAKWLNPNNNECFLDIEIKNSQEITALMEDYNLGLSTLKKFGVRKNLLNLSQKKLREAEHERRQNNEI